MVLSMEGWKKHSTKIIQSIGKPFALALKQANACFSELDFGRAAATGPAMLGEYFSDLFSLFFHPWPVCSRSSSSGDESFALHATLVINMYAQLLCRLSTGAHSERTPPES